MNWEDKATELLEYIEQGIKATGEFAADQAPILVQEFYMWFTAHHIFMVVVGFIMFLLGIWFYQIGQDSDKHKRGKDLISKSDGFWIIPMVLTPLIGFGMFLDNLYNLIQILVAPRIYLIEQLSNWLQ